MGTLRAKTLVYPGSYGLNTQEATLTDEETRFASVVTNGVIDGSGKLTSREDFVKQTSNASSAVESMFVWKQTDATEVVLSAMAGKIYSGTNTFTERIDYSSSSTTSNSWQFAVLGSLCMMVQSGVLLKLRDENFSNATTSGAAFTRPNVCMAAFGRMWVADDTSIPNSYTIWWSNLLDAKSWVSGDAGSIDLSSVWPDGADRIVNLAALGNRLVVFGRKSILMYTIPASNDPASMSVSAEDIIYDLGLVSRDAMQVTDDGIYFLSDNGVYKITKLGQTTSLLAREHVSQLVTDDLRTSIDAQTNLTLIRSSFYPVWGLFLLSFPTQNKSYCFHTRKKVPDVEGAVVVTTWTNVGRAFQAFAVDSSQNWYAGMLNGVHLYSGYTPDGASNAYNLVWAPQWLPFEDETRLKHFKSMTLAIYASNAQTGSVSWSVDYKEDTTRSESFTVTSEQFAEAPGVGYVRIPLGGSGKVIKPTVTFPISGDRVTIHQAQLYATPGAVKP